MNIQKGGIAFEGVPSLRTVDIIVTHERFESTRVLKVAHIDLSEGQKPRIHWMMIVFQEVDYFLGPVEKLRTTKMNTLELFESF